MSENDKTAVTEGTTEQEAPVETASEAESSAVETEGSAAETPEADDSPGENPLATLTSLVLDAADAANDSAQSASDAIAKLSTVVEANESAVKAVRNAPAIFGAIMLSVGVVMAVVVAIVSTNVTSKSDELQAVVLKQAAQLEEVNKALKSLEMFGEELRKFENIAEDTTQRAIVTLREQIKADRAVMQEIEAKRLQDLFRSVSGEGGRVAAANAKARDEQTAQMGTVDQRLSKLEGQLSETLALLKARPAASSTRTTAVLSDAQAKDMRTTLAEVGALKQEVAALRASLERNSAALEPGMPVFRRDGE
ncbi:MAG: hypothetical protein ACO3IL_08215 [Steroidobacteraceae bacterium]|jgi:HAMP domain-containing protein